MIIFEVSGGVGHNRRIIHLSNIFLRHTFFLFEVDVIELRLFADFFMALIPLALNFFLKEVFPF